MFKIIKYSFKDMIRSRWSFVYLAFYFVLGMILLFLNNDLNKAIVTLMNVTITLTPLIGTLFGVMYFYSSREFTDLLLAQPINRTSIFVGQYAGISASLSMSLVLGLGIPFVIYGLFMSSQIFNFLLLLVTGVALTLIFVALAIMICLAQPNKIKGFGYAILTWLFFTVIYDGLILLVLMVFEDYPLDKVSLAMSLFNPVDLSRILILLKLDISALLGYTGAVFQNFFGTGQGILVSLSLMLIWIVVPVWGIKRISSKRDF